MNDTRKAIIEIIEPYMDKTLSEGCLMEILNNIERLIDNYNYATYDTDVSDYENTIYMRPTNCKILWHYDITAVLQYIRKIKNKNIQIIDINDEWFFYQDQTEMKNFNFSIPNKPLHLYTEAEEKELLNILKLINKKWMKQEKL